MEPINISGQSYLYLITLGLVAGLGLISRLVPIGSILWDKYLGDVVYAAVFYLGQTRLRPRGSIIVKAFLTMLYVIAIETFQLTNIPAQLSQSESLTIRLFTYLVLGSRFSGWDLLSYGIGISGIGWVDRFYRST